MSKKQSTTVKELSNLEPTTTIIQPLHERFPDGSTMILTMFSDFGNIGQPIRIFKDNKPVYDDNNKPVYNDSLWTYPVLDENGETIGNFKYSRPEISWAVVKVQCNHYTNEDTGKTYLFFKLINKLDKISDVQSFDTGRGNLLELKEQI